MTFMNISVKVITVIKINILTKDTFNHFIKMYYRIDYIYIYNYNFFK